MYVFLCLWLLLATYCYWRGYISRHWAWWLGFTVCAALATYTQYLAAFYLLPLAAWPLLTRNWRILRNVAISGLAALVLCLPWLIHLPSQFAKVDQAYWVERPEPYKLLTLLLVYVTNLPLPGWQLAAGLFAALGVVSVALLQTMRAVRNHSPGYRDALWLVYLSFAPPILMFGFSQWMPVFVERALLPSGAVFCVWLAWSLVEAHQPRQIALLSAILLAASFTMGLYQHVIYADFPYAPFDALTRNLESNRQSGDVIVHSSKLSMLPSAYFDRTLPETFLADPPGSAVDTLAPATQRVIEVQAEPDIRSATENARRVWYVIFDQSNREYVQAGYPRHPDLTWLMETYSLLQVSHWGDLTVFLFSRGS
jgi:4-amino-4-deoxy-L-arabinose transferase-like glycosyltransferase